jgi:hypothetical protein
VDQGRGCPPEERGGAPIERWPLVAPGYYSSSLLGTSVVSVGDGASVEPVHWTVAGEAFFFVLLVLRTCAQDLSFREEQ